MFVTLPSATPLSAFDWFQRRVFAQRAEINTLVKCKPCLGKGLAIYCKAETTFTFHFSTLTLSNAFIGIDNREMKSEGGFSFAIASQPF